MTWVTTLLAGTGGKIALAGAVIGGLVLIGWILVRVGVKRGLAMARESDARLRAASEKASGGGYAAEHQRLEQVDPVTGAPRGGPGHGGVRAGNPGGRPA